VLVRVLLVLVFLAVKRLKSRKTAGVPAAFGAILPFLG
jgi:hypothetical protein